MATHHLEAKRIKARDVIAGDKNVSMPSVVLGNLIVHLGETSPRPLSPSSRKANVSPTPGRERRTQQIDGLRADAKLLKETLQLLKDMALPESDEEIALRLAKRISIMELEIAELDGKISVFEERIRSEVPKRLALGIDYRHQTLVLKGWQERATNVATLAAAFIVRGSSTECGYDALFSRFLGQIRNSYGVRNAPDVIRISRPHLFSNRLVWEYLARELGVVAAAARSEELVVNRLVERCQTRAVILRVDNLECATPGALNLLLVDFWDRVVAMAAHLKFPLILFVIDRQGITQSCNLVPVTQVDNDWSCRRQILLWLPDRFERQEIEIWFDANILDLPPLWVGARDDAIREILNKTDNGIPMRVMEYLVLAYNCSFLSFLEALE